MKEYEFQKMQTEFDMVTLELRNSLNKLFNNVSRLQEQINIINHKMEEIQNMLHDDGK